jgi:FKBP-type peptidyl-prolyl cis-trans isomerase FklB
LIWGAIGWNISQKNKDICCLSQTLVISFTFNLNKIDFKLNKKGNLMTRRYLILPLLLCFGSQVPAQASTEASQTEASQTEASQTEASQTEASQTEASQTEALQTEASQSLSSYKDKLSYWFGQNFGKNIQGYMTEKALDLDEDKLLQGLKDSLLNKPSLLADEEIKSVLMRFQKEKFEKLAAKNLKEGEDWLAENKKKEGVITLPNRLQYKVIKNGEGKTPKSTDKVLTHYRGTLIDGRQFDSSYDRGEPASFAVNRVIKGWTEALLLMQEGDKWELFIPTQLAYGKHVRPGSPIGPNAALIFEIELLKVLD